MATFQILRAPLRPAIASPSPVGLKATAVTAPACPLSDCTSAPDSASNTCTVPSPPAAAAIRWPSGEHAIDTIGIRSTLRGSCRRNSAVILRVFASQILIVASQLPLANHSPLGENATV